MFQSGSSPAIPAVQSLVTLLPQVKGAVFSQHSALQQIEGMCRLHRPEQKPAVSPMSTCPCQAIAYCTAWLRVAVDALHTVTAAAAQQVAEGAVYSRCQTLSISCVPAAVEKVAFQSFE
jgi:hypothetical protein